LDSLELYPFKRVIDAGAKSVMVGHLSVPAIDTTEGLPATLSRPVTSDLLRKQLRFEGLIVTDAMDMMGVVRGFSNAEASVKAIQAGADVLLLPENEDGAVHALVVAVKSREISETRIDESVRRVLLAKQWLGLDLQRYVSIDKIGESVSTPDHLQLAKAVARDAITVLKNEGHVLPLKPDEKKKVVSVQMHDRDDNWSEVHRPGNPWPIEPAGEYFTRLLRERFPLLETMRLGPSATTVDVERALKKIESADLVLIPVYVKVRTSSGRIGIPKNLQPVVQKMNELHVPSVVIAFGNPYNIASFPRANALVCAYTDAEPLTEASVEALLGAIPWRGKLPIEIHKLYPFGSGLQSAQTSLRRDSPRRAGFQPHKLQRLDSILVKAIQDSAFPAAQLLVAKDGIIVYEKSMGTFTYDKNSRNINSETLFDLASLTKVVATTSAIMKLYDGKKISLDDKVSLFMPQFAEGKKSEITIRHLLTHTSGLPPFRQLWRFVPDAKFALDSVYATNLVANPGDTTIYSDLGFITLGKIVEGVSGSTLDEFMKENFFEPLGMSRTMFAPSAALWKNVAPTEYDSTWRKTLVRGRVHDENAEFLGGVSGHAGLFSTASDLSILMQMLMNGGTYGDTRYLDSSTIALFTKRQSEKSTRALGWDTKSPKGSMAGNLFSNSSFGHSGFTGTTLWADPERNLFVILLTNRVHPTRVNSKIARVRPAVHDAVVEAFAKP
jgi:CubicO group peptidase (beta-lactamase class C family)